MSAVIYNQDHQVGIQASTTIHVIVKAAVELAEGLSVDRLAPYYAEQFEAAARTIRERLAEANGTSVPTLAAPDRTSRYFGPQDRERLLAKLKDLGDKLGSMSDDEWGNFVNGLPEKEFLAMIALDTEARDGKGAALNG